MKNRETIRQEYEQIEALLAEGKKVPEIARLLGMSPSAVYHRLSRHRGPKPETKVVWVRLPLATHAALLRTAAANKRAMAIEGAFLIEHALQAAAAPFSVECRPGPPVPP
jgi:predicted transcriptional regulator